MALIGSGSRGPAIACAIVILVSLFFFLAAGSISLAWPRWGLRRFLSQISRSRRSNTSAPCRQPKCDCADEFPRRPARLGLGILRQHPLIGVGIQGFRYASPNPALYNWPHNIFLEIACEMGIPAALIACAVFVSAIRESLRQLTDQCRRHFMLSQLAAALLMIGVINGTNTGDINSDRSTWLFLSLVFVVEGSGLNPPSTGISPSRQHARYRRSQWPLTQRSYRPYRTAGTCAAPHHVPFHDGAHRTQEPLISS